MNIPWRRRKINEYATEEKKEERSRVTGTEICGLWLKINIIELETSLYALCNPQQMLNNVDVDFTSCTLIDHMSGLSLSAVLATCSIINHPLQQAKTNSILNGHFTHRIVPYCPKFMRSTHCLCSGNGCLLSQTIHSFIAMNNCSSLTVNQRFFQI